MTVGHGATYRERMNRHTMMPGPIVIRIGAFILACAWSPARIQAEPTNTTGHVTAWTPDGTATFVQPDDPALIVKPGAKAPPLLQPDPAVVRSLIETMDQSLTALSEKSSSTDTTYYANGEWHFGTPCYACSTGPAGMAAALWAWRQAHPESMDAAAKARQAWLHQVAVETFDTCIAKRLQPNGRILDPGSHETFLFVEFASTYGILKETLDAPTRQRWLNAMRLEVQGMQDIGQLPNPALTNGAPWKRTDGWYVNGNVDLCQAAWIYAVWQATGEQQYKDLFELTWKHVLSPSQARWKGYGLYFLKMPTQDDGSDGSGYITEAAGAPGFDRNYGMLQLSTVARLYQQSRDPRVLRVMNLLCNALLPHLDRKTMILDCLYGSRHSDFMPFATSGVASLAWLGGRADLAPLLPDQMRKAVPAVYLNNALQNQNNPYAYRGYGFDLATMLEAARAAQP